ncbi:PKD domain-containing protein [Aurantibacter sp.]|uniref:PKD domain-containing protein n=1 Tax=Aurantibacter sp. TaxID=2807103 RepID=UPI003264233A
MNFHPTRLNRQLIVSFLLSLGLVISCSKDSDLIDDALFNNASQSIEDRQTVTEETPVEEEPIIEEEELVIEEGINDIEIDLESRTTTFPAKYDAHYQTGKSYNQHIVRLEEGNRTSYLMFDLSQIDSIGGQITAAKLQFTINSDDGDGTINVHKGNTEDWTEHNLTSIPEAEIEIGSIIKQYKIGATEEIELEAEQLEPKLSTLILDHEDGNDLAFASKEHPTVDGPKLIVTYDAPIDSEQIVVSEILSTEEENIVEEEINEEISTDDNESPIAIADGNPSTGTAPLKVTFKGSNSTDNTKIETYKWIFNDGTSSTDVNPEHTFEKAGEYEVELTVTDNEGNSNTDTVTITVNDEDNEAPKAVASATPNSGVAPLKVQFKGSNSTDDNGVKSYAWDFNDGKKATNANPEHTFDEVGDYKVSLTVTDENGLSSTKTVTIKVSKPEENEAPKAVASATPTSGLAPLEVQFKGSNSTDDNKITSFKWDFKDGSTATSSNPSHTFIKAGEYNVLLTIKDEEGLSSNKTVTIKVSEPAENEAPNAVASATPTSGDAPLEVQFKGSNSTDDTKITSYHWDFKDGSSSTSSNPSHTFNNAGSYSVKLTVKDAEGLTSTKTITITANEISSGGDNGGSNGNYPSHAVFASNYGFKSGDATSAFEAALTSGKSYVVIDKQSSDWVIRPTRIFDLSNMTIVFESGVTLRAKSGAFSASDAVLFEMFRSKNVTIEGNGAIFRMNKSEYNSGESRHALSIRQGDNVKVNNLTLRDSGGDGLYIAGGNSLNYSKNITINNVSCLNNRRNGMSIISARNVWVNNSDFSQSNGTNPETGVDLEPNTNNEELVNINFNGCKFSSNDSAGFQISPHKLNGSSPSMSVKVSNSSFSYNSKSTNGKPNTEIYLNPGDQTNPVQGTVTFENVKFNGSQHRVLFSKKRSNEYKVVFRNCSAYDVIKSGGNAPIELQRQSGSNTVGNYEFSNFYLEYNKNEPFLEILAPSSGFTVKNISGSFTIKEPYDNSIRYTNGYNASKNVNVNISAKHIN